MKQFDEKTDMKPLAGYVKKYLDAKGQDLFTVIQAISVMDAMRVPLRYADSRLCLDIVNAVEEYCKILDMAKEDEHYQVWDVLDEEDILLELPELY